MTIEAGYKDGAYMTNKPINNTLGKERQLFLEICKLLSKIKIEKRQLLFFSFPKQHRHGSALCSDGLKVIR